MQRARQIVVALMAVAIAPIAHARIREASAPSVAPDAAGRSHFLRAGEAMPTTAPVARWWEVLDDPVLDQLVGQAVAGSPDMAMAQARIAQARANLKATRAAELPRINAALAAPTVNMPTGTLGIRDDMRIADTSYIAGFDAAWEIDLFGANRRRAAAAAARAQAAEAQAADLRLSLTAEIARAYVLYRLQQATIAIQQRQLAVDRDLVAMARQRYGAGLTPSLPLDMAEDQILRSEAALASTRAETQILADQLAVLTGQEPGALDALLAAPAPVPLPPQEVAIGDPARLLSNRPDIRRAERQLAAAGAEIAARKADRLPKINFIGLLGLGGPAASDLLDPGRLLGAALPQLRWLAFDGGQSEAALRMARAGRDEAEASYRHVVLAALQDAESALARFGVQRIALAGALQSQTRATRSAELFGQRAASGTASTREHLESSRRALDAELNAVSAQAALTTSFIAVEKALGLGWADPGKP